MDAVDTADATDVAPFYVRYRNAQYDLRHFVHKHPGGRSTLHGLDGRDMEQRLRNAPPHSAAAMYLLREYRVDATTDVDENNNEQRKADGRLPDEWDAQTDDSMEVCISCWRFVDDDWNFVCVFVCVFMVCTPLIAQAKARPVGCACVCVYGCASPCGLTPVTMKY